MGFLSGLFGGGSKTVVTQAAQNKTDVTVTSQIANIIDIDALAEAVKAMGNSVQGAIDATGKQTQALFAGLQQASLITALAGLKAKTDQTAVLEKGLNMAKNLVKFAAISFGVTS